MAVLNPTTSTIVPTPQATAEHHEAAAPPRVDTLPRNLPRIGDLPRIEDPSAVSPTDARALSKTLFARLAVLEEG
ncbi:RNA polymerase sigma factor SigF, partial [Kitasatospora sp. NPDC094015]